MVEFNVVNRLLIHIFLGKIAGSRYLNSGLRELGCGVAALVGVEAPLNMPLLPWNADPPTGVGRKAMGRITALPWSDYDTYILAT